MHSYSCRWILVLTTVVVGFSLGGCSRTFQPPPDAGLTDDAGMDTANPGDSGTPDTRTPDVRDPDTQPPRDVDPDAVCGNGVREGSEECDDGNTRPGDGCGADCRTEGVPPNRCGNGVVEGNEQCDDGNRQNGDGCNRRCAIEDVPPPPICGDGVVDPGEECDDGNNERFDGCSPTCQFEEMPPLEACLNDSDIQQWETGIASEVATECALSCLGEPDDLRAQCATDCTQANADITEECALCFGLGVSCAIENCLVECAADPFSDQCRRCQNRFCTDEFQICSGLPSLFP